MGSPSLFKLDGLPVGERFDCWWETVARSIVSVDASSAHAVDFWAEMRTVDLGLVQISRVRCNSFEARRTAGRIRRSDPGLYQLSLTIRGSSGMRQERREASLSPGDLTLYDTSRVFHAWTVADSPAGRPDPSPGGMADGVILQFPRNLLPLPAAQVTPLLAVRLCGRKDFGPLVSGLLRQLLAQESQFTPADAVRISTAILDLVAALLAHQSGRSSLASLNDPQRVQLLLVQSFIETRLGERDLTPSVVAAAHHTSTRSLHRLFRAQDTTVAAWIRGRRLERCRRDLADPALHDRPIHAIAARWGFTVPANFTRAFRAAYGLSPQEYRHLCRRPSDADAR